MESWKKVFAIIWNGQLLSTLGSAVGLPNTFIISGTAITLLGIVSFFVPAIRNMAIRSGSETVN